MEELYILLSERAAHIEELHSRLATLPAYLSSNATELKSNPTNRPREYSEFFKTLTQIKKNEKMRIIKEDELIDIVFNLKIFDLPQRQRFQEKSLETMKQLRKDFSYKKPRNTNDIKDIASLYLNYFFFTGMSHKVEDLKRTYVDNKLRGFPIISVLFKWLVEMSRDNFKNIIKDVTQDYESKLSVPAARPEKTPIRIQSPKSGRFLITSSKPQKTQEDEPLNEKIPTEEFEPVCLAKKVHRHPLFSSSGNLNRLDKYKEIMKDTNSVVLDSLPLSCSHGPKQMGSGSFSGLNDFQLAAMKQFNRSSVSATLPVKKKNPLIQVCLEASGNTRYCLDPIDDLDVTYIPTLNLSVGIQKQTKRLKGPNLLTVDTDKKKEVITQVYKNLYGRNFEVEKTITGFYFKNLQEGKITYTAHVANKKGDAFLEEYTVDYFEKFYSNFVPKENNQNTSQLPDSCSSSFNSSQIKKVRKQLKTPSAVPIEKGAGVRQSKRPSTALIVKGALRSSSSSNLSPPGHKPLPKEVDEVPEMNLNDGVGAGSAAEESNSSQNKKEEEEQQLHNIVRRTSKTRKKPVDFSKMESALGNFLEGLAVHIPSESTVIMEQGDNDRPEKMLYVPDTENQFRILKVANFLHKVSPTKTDQKEQLRLKGVDEPRNISPIVTNLLGKLYSTSTKTQGSDDEDNNSRTPTNNNVPPNFIRGQYYVKKPNGREEELATEKSASISITKLKPNTPNLNALFLEQKKIPPPSMDRKLSKDSKSSPQGVLYKSVKFPEVSSMSRKPSKEKSTMILEVDTSSKVVLVQRHKSIDNEKKLAKQHSGEEDGSPKRKEGMGVVELQFEGKGNMVANVRKHLRRVKTSHQNGVRR